MIFNPVEASTPPHQATPPVAAPPSPPPALQTEMRPAWVIKLEQDLVKIERQEYEQQQAAQLAQQQHITIEEVEDDEPLSYVEGTLQPLIEESAFPGHYQIKFPGEQIEDKMNSDVEEIEPLPVPLRDHRPSGFAMPPLPPHQPTPSPPLPQRVQPFPEAVF